ncbi:complex I subunit 5 family protein [Kitasatospora cheerisanensis]
MGAVAYALTGFRIEDPRPLHGALAFGIVNSLAAYCSLLGIGLLYARTGELGLAQLGRALDGRPPDALVRCAFVLVLAGPLVKAAAAPFHFWLPDAHAVAPSPVCMLLSGVMVELGVYGAARIHRTVFAGPGGVPADAVRPVLLALGVVTALVGAVMCWQQRHLKRLLAFSTVGHIGLFLVSFALLTPAGVAGAAVYLAGHAGCKAALFGLCGVLLDRFGSVDEHGLFGRGRELPFTAALFALGGLALAGLPPFGTGLGKALAEDAAGEWAWWLPALYVLVSAVTGGAVLRACARVFGGRGRHPAEHPDEPETTGEGEEPEVRDPTRPLPLPVLAVPALLLAACLAIGLCPPLARQLAAAAARFTDRAGYLDAVLHEAAALPALVPPPAGWTAPGLLLGLLSTALACALAAAALRGPLPAPPGPAPAPRAPPPPLRPAGRLRHLAPGRPGRPARGDHRTGLNRRPRGTAGRGAEDRPRERGAGGAATYRMRTARPAGSGFGTRRADAPSVRGGEERQQAGVDRVRALQGEAVARAREDLGLRVRDQGGDPAQHPAGRSSALRAPIRARTGTVIPRSSSSPKGGAAGRAAGFQVRMPSISGASISGGAASAGLASRRARAGRRRRGASMPNRPATM